jgi:hypothetical protein
MVACTDDGQIFVANLTTGGATDPYKIYAFQDDDPLTHPYLLWGGDPGNGNNQRWGDNLDVRNTAGLIEVLIASRNAKVVALLRGTVGLPLDPVATLINVADADNGNFGLSVAFGDGATFWGKASGSPLRQVGYDLVTGVGTVLRTITNYPSMSVIAVDNHNQLLAGATLETPDTLRLLDIATPLSGPLELDTEFFPTDNANANGTGEVRFGTDSFGYSKLFALDSNNGIIALNVGGRLHESLDGNMLTLTWHGTHTLQATPDLTQAFTNVVGAVSGFMVDTTLAGQQFFRLRD